LILEFLSSQAPPDDLARFEKQLLRLAPEDAAEQKIRTTTEITEEYGTASGICHAAEQFNADAICIGSHTRPGLAAKILGSVSLSVLQKSRRPVLVVWPHAN
jgi:nucleotide-binding universal stress UspA family protein